MISVIPVYQNLNSNVKDNFERRLDKKVKILDKYLKKDSFNSELIVKVNQINNSQTEISMQFSLPKKVIRLTKTANDPFKALEIIYNALKENTLNYLDQLKTRRKKITKIENNLEELLPILTKSETVEEFGERLIPHITSLKSYIKRRVRFAYLTGATDKNSISPLDAVQDVIGEAYREFTKKPSHQSLIRWLYFLADRVLEDKLHERKYEEKNFDSLEQLIDQQIETLDPDMIMDAEGGLYNEDEFENQEKEYDISVLENLTIPDYFQQLTESKRLRKTLRILGTLPEEKRSIFDLFIMDGLSVEDIASVKKLKLQEVNNIIDEVVEYVQKMIK